MPVDLISVMNVERRISMIQFGQDLIKPLLRKINCAWSAIPHRRWVFRWSGFTFIKRYVGRVEGYDEIDGRFCRNYIALLGATKKDVKAICAANGINDTEEQENIWGKLNKEKKEPVPGKYVWFTDDLRELSGMIEDRIIKQQIERGELA